MYTALQFFCITIFSFYHNKTYLLGGGERWCVTRPNDFLGQVLALDASIRFAGLADSKGTKAYHKYREGLKPLLSPEETDKSMLQAVLRNDMRSTLEDKLGQCMYVIGMYKKVKRITIPMYPPVAKERGILMISLDLDSDRDDIIAKKVLPFLENARLDL